MAKEIELNFSGSAGAGTPLPTAEAAEKLSPQELAQVEDFSRQIDLKNTRGVMEYGTGTQKKMSAFSESALGNVRSKDLGEVGSLLSGVVTEIKSFDVDEKGVVGFFKRSANKLQALKNKYNKVSVNIDKICDELEGHKITLLKDISMLDTMYETNLSYFKELTMYILAGKKKLTAVRESELPALRAQAEGSGRQEDAQAVNDLEAMCNRFEKKIYDLELTKTIAMQTAPQIRLVQNNDVILSEKIQSVLVNTIPLWKNQMVLALGLEHSRQAVEYTRAVTDATNEMLKKNADMLKQSTIETATESERGIVDIETLEHTNRSLLETIDEVLQIQREGHARRQEAEVKLAAIESELKQKLLEGSSK